MKVLVTGAAGFVGSHLCEYLITRGDDVRGVDSFTDYYATERKRRNVERLGWIGSFSLTVADLVETDLDDLLDGIEVVYHLAGQPGVRPSWGSNFSTYIRQNIDATQQLLEAVKDRPLKKLVYASSSSVYGDAETLPTSESVRPHPISPYGVTKLAAEHLCELYRANFGVPSVSLRLFTVYGPRQRPDMAFSRLCAAAAERRPFELFGDGTQTRDFTFVSDVTRAMRDAAESAWCGVANIGGGSRVSMVEVIQTVNELCGPIEVVRTEAQKGDVRHTGADISVAAAAFGYAPEVGIRDGLGAMVSDAFALAGSRAS
jgi:nucleoside-diphosphate-sugar epimerase